jgi:hypothetical protein
MAAKSSVFAVVVLSPTVTVGKTISTSNQLAVMRNYSKEVLVDN